MTREDCRDIASLSGCDTQSAIIRSRSGGPRSPPFAVIGGNRWATRDDVMVLRFGRAVAVIGALREETWLTKRSSVGAGFAS